MKRQRGNNKTTAMQIKKSIDLCNFQINELKKFKLWARNFGNSLPHIYYDKGDLRAYSYSVNSCDLKELSGDIFGKEGHDFEIEVFQELTSRGYKVLLNDLTSLIRHGDIMVMEREIPQLMELKTSKATSKKADKQLKNMKLVQEYLLTDSSTDLRGGNAISMRIASEEEEVSNRVKINKNLEKTKLEGYNFSKIETGLYCFSILHGADYSKADMSLFDEIKKPLFISLNEYKNTQDHSLFYPYSLSINDPEIFSCFICGHLSIYFFIDWDVIEEKAKKNQLTFDLLPENHVIEILSNNTPTMYSYTFIKAIVEFSSINWAIDEMCMMYHKSVNISQNYKEDC